MMATEQHCNTLHGLDRVKAIRAIHEALLQLSSPLDNLDNRGAIESLRDCMRDAGHAGFTK